MIVLSSQITQIKVCLAVDALIDKITEVVTLYIKIYPICINPSIKELLNTNNEEVFSNNFNLRNA